MKISKRRKEMGEEAWAEYQRQRQNKKAKAWVAKNVVGWQRRTKEKLIEYKGGKCEVCGYDKNFPSAYDFHHRNPEEKSFTISSKMIKFEKLVEEVDKCDLLCCRCHRELHEKEFAIQRRLSKERHEKWLQKIEIPKKSGKCIDCNKDIDVYVTRCAECNAVYRRKVDRPSKEALGKLLWEKPTMQLAEEFGVSDVAISKWAKSYGLSKPPRGYWEKEKSKIIPITKEKLEKLLWEKSITALTKDFKVNGTTINKWIALYGINKPPVGYWNNRK